MKHACKFEVGETVRHYASGKTGTVERLIWSPAIVGQECRYPGFWRVIGVGYSESQDSFTYVGRTKDQGNGVGTETDSELYG